MAKKQPKKGKKSEKNPNSQYDRQSKELSTRKKNELPCILFSFRYHDINQGQTFKDWENDGLLELLNERLKSLNNQTLPQAFSSGLLKQYNRVSFPPDSDFNHPQHVPPNSTWGVLLIRGKIRVAGFFEENIFHLVFLDKEHQFWKCSDN